MIHDPLLLEAVQLLLGVEDKVLSKDLPSCPHCGGTERHNEDCPFIALMEKIASEEKEGVPNEQA